MRRTPPRALLLATLLLTPIAAPAQWQILDSNTTADLRGIDNVGGGVVWASGSNGTVLRSEDAGYVWQHCAVPPNAEHLDFRGIQAFDANTAIVMSSGKGPLSRLYKTTDGCQTWHLLFTNPDKDGFWDAIQFPSEPHGFILGDPVLPNRGSALSLRDHRPYFFLSETLDGGQTWTQWHDWSDSISPLAAFAGATAIFAASNSSMLVDKENVIFGTGGQQPSFVTVEPNPPGSGMICDCSPMPTPAGLNGVHGTSDPIPLAAGESAGVFSIVKRGSTLIAVGGDYTKPNDATRTAAFSLDSSDDWAAATTPPHGYRSAVAYDPTHHLWITVGPNGTDISTDDGRNWRALHPDPALHDAPDADKNWNALSLPFVVGPKGRIGRLEPSALAVASH